jgi:hypothetical protein
MSATGMDKDIKEVVVPREEAVFRMDENGVWHNRHGRMTHSRIIEYFNTAIEQDADGYFLYQAYDNIREKVYFPCEGTALFAVDVIMDSGITLVLNTKKRVPLLPEALFTEKGHLCMRLDESYIRFSERVMMIMLDYIEEKNGIYGLKKSG